MALSSSRQAPRLVAQAMTAMTAIAILPVVACDSFDFGRVTGVTSTAAPSASSAIAGAASSALVTSPGADLPTAAIPPPQDLVVLLGGEVSLGGTVKTWLSANRKYDPLEGLRPLYEGANLAVASLASPIAETTPSPPGKTPATAQVGPVAAADALARSGLRILDVGSEALWAAGSAAFASTLSNLGRVAVSAVGASAEGPAAAATAPARVVIRGRAVSVIATEKWPAKSPFFAQARDHVAFVEPSALADSVRSAKKDGALVIVSVGGEGGGGGEQSDAPAADVVLRAHAAIDAGADVIVAHGSRTPLGVGFVAGHPILYGLGNLVADDDPKNPWTGRGFVARLVFGASGPPSLDLCPLLVVDGEPKLLSGPSRATEEGIFERAIERLSKPLGGVSIGEPDLHSCLRVTPSVK